MGRVSRRTRRVPHGGAPHREVGCAIVTVSDTRRGDDDLSGAAIARLLERAGHRVRVRAWVRDDPVAIRRAVREAIAREDVEVVVTTGGTGIAPRDRTPEALAPIVTAWLPGFGEHFRALSRAQVGTAAWLSRAAAGVAGRTLIVMLPGSVPAVTLAVGRVLLPELLHAVRMLGRSTP